MRNETDKPFSWFADDMPVLTGKGFMPIESVGIGDLVLTGSDGWKPVLETMTE